MSEYRNPPSVEAASGITTIVGILRDAPNGQIWNNSLLAWEPDGTTITGQHQLATSEINPYASVSDYELSKAQCDAALNATTAQSLQVRFYDSSGPTKIGKAEYGSAFEIDPVLWTPDRFLQDITAAGVEISGQTEIIRGRFIVPDGITVTTNPVDPSYLSAASDDGGIILPTLGTNGQFTVQPSDGDDYIDVRLQITADDEVIVRTNRVAQRKVLAYDQYLSQESLDASLAALPAVKMTVSNVC